MNSSVQPGAFNKMAALQAIKSAINGRAFVAEKACHLVAAGKARSVPVDESKYIPLTEQGNPQIVHAILD